MRGKVHDFNQIRRSAGITPSYAGKSCAEQARRFHLRDHPRVCGEKWCTDLGDGCDWGSPPRMRGKGLSGKRGRRRLGITPAYAGKSHADHHLGNHRRDHPRLCGEKYGPSAPGLRRWGSPPRVRGKVLCLQSGNVIVGITPAYAGKSCPPQAPTFTRQDHPRVCGEKAVPENVHGL